jgi:hypothetical protein
MVEDKGHTPISERVPIRVISPLIEEWQEKFRATHEEAAKNNGSSRYVATALIHEGCLGILSEHCGISARVLRRIKNGKHETG